jgi:hypothetical protein
LRTATETADSASLICISCSVIEMPCLEMNFDLPFPARASHAFVWRSVNSLPTQAQAKSQQNLAFCRALCR